MMPKCTFHVSIDSCQLFFSQGKFHLPISNAGINGDAFRKISFSLLTSCQPVGYLLLCKLFELALLLLPNRKILMNRKASDEATTTSVITSWTAAISPTRSSATRAPGTTAPPAGTSSTCASTSSKSPSTCRSEELIFERAEVVKKSLSWFTSVI